MRRLALGVTLFGAMLSLLFAVPAAAQNFGAIATNPDGAWGWSGKYATVDEAQERALNECNKHGRNCRLLRVFQDACVAVVRNEVRGKAIIAWVSGGERKERVRRALRDCRNEGGDDCQILKEFCTGRYSDVDE
jgi:erythromycin esterase-like protein